MSVNGFWARKSSKMKFLVPKNYLEKSKKPEVWEQQNCASMDSFQIRTFTKLIWVQERSNALHTSKVLLQCLQFGEFEIDLFLSCIWTLIDFPFAGIAKKVKSLRSYSQRTQSNHIYRIMLLPEKFIETSTSTLLQLYWTWLNLFIWIKQRNHLTNQTQRPNHENRYVISRW